MDVSKRSRIERLYVCAACARLGGDRSAPRPINVARRVVARASPPADVALAHARRVGARGLVARTTRASANTARIIPSAPSDHRRARRDVPPVAPVARRARRAHDTHNLKIIPGHRASYKTASSAAARAQSLHFSRANERLRTGGGVGAPRCVWLSALTSLWTRERRGALRECVTNRASSRAITPRCRS